MIQVLAASTLASQTPGSAPDASIQGVAPGPAPAALPAPSPVAASEEPRGEIVDGATPDMSAQEVFALANRHPSPADRAPSISWEELAASRDSYVPQAITPLVDNDMNDARYARWFNVTDTQFLGESING